MTKSSTFSYQILESPSKLRGFPKVLDKRTLLIIFLLLFLSVSFCVYWLRIGFNIEPLREGLYLFTSFFATVASFFALRAFGFKNERARTLIFLTSGIVCWFIGEVMFNYYEYILHIEPFPSIADVFYLTAYPLLMFGLINEIKISKINWKKISKTSLFLFSVVAALFAIIVWYFGIYKAYDPSEVFLNNAIAISYGIGDLFLILVSILLLILTLEFRGGRLSRVWFILFLSFVFTLVADILFAIYLEEYDMQIWFYKSLLDSFWMIGYLLFALAFFEFGFSIQDVYQKIKSLKRLSKK